MIGFHTEKRPWRQFVPSPRRSRDKGKLQISPPPKSQGTLRWEEEAYGIHFSTSQGMVALKSGRLHEFRSAGVKNGESRKDVQSNFREARREKGANS